MCRYVHGHNLCSYLYLADYFGKYKDLDLLRLYGMVNEEELRMLCCSGEKNPSYLLMGWAVRILAHMSTKGWLIGAAPDYAATRGCFLNMKSALDRIHELENRPIPFAYCHAFNVAIHAYLFLGIFCWQTYLDDCYLAVVGYGVMSFFLLGFQKIAAILAKPVGRGAMKVDVIAAALGAFSDQMHMLEENVRLPLKLESAIRGDIYAAAGITSLTLLTEEQKTAIRTGSAFAYKTCLEPDPGSMTKPAVELPDDRCSKANFVVVKVEDHGQPFREEAMNTGSVVLDIAAMP